MSVGSVGRSGHEAASVMRAQSWFRNGSRRLLSVLCALACLPLLAVAIGCGGSDDGQRGGPGPTASATRGVDDATVAKQAALRIEDFPSGWRAASDVPNVDSGCEQVEAAKRLTSARHNSPQFNRGQTLAQNVIYVFADEATAREAFTMVSGEETPSCYAKAVAGAFASQAGVELGQTKTAQLSIVPVGDEYDAARVTLPISAQGQEIDVSIDLVFVRASRSLTLSLFVNVPTPFEAGLRDQLIAAAVKRLSDATS